MEGDITFALLCAELGCRVAEFGETSIDCSHTWATGGAEVCWKELVEIDGTSSAMEQEITCILEAVTHTLIVPDKHRQPIVTDIRAEYMTGELGRFNLCCQTSLGHCFIKVSVG